MTNSELRSWVVYFFKRKFGLQEGQLGSIFFTTSIISAASMLVASSIAKRIGNVKVSLRFAKTCDALWILFSDTIL